MPQHVRTSATAAPTRLPAAWRALIKNSSSGWWSRYGQKAAAKASAARSAAALAAVSTAPVIRYLCRIGGAARHPPWAVIFRIGFRPAGRANVARAPPALRTAPRLS
jgi:hypothetical protein